MSAIDDDRKIRGLEEPESSLLSVIRGRRVQSALKEIAEWILPREQRKCTFQIETESQSLHYLPVRKNRPDARVSIRILHRNNWDQPIDECEQSCLNNMVRALLALGARENEWRKEKSRMSTVNGST
jgi:hypothetical protein